MAHSLVFKHIPSEDINATRFQTFKKWTSYHHNFSGSYGIQIWKGTLDDDWGKYDYPLGFMKVLPNPDGRDQKSLWYNVNGLYYKEEKYPLDIEYSPFMVRRLHKELAYVQLPQQYTGEGIKLGSVLIENGPVNDDDLTPGGPATESRGHGVDGTVELYYHTNTFAINETNIDQDIWKVVKPWSWNLGSLPYTITNNQPNTDTNAATNYVRKLWWKDHNFNIPEGSVIDKIVFRVNHQSTSAHWDRNWTIDVRLMISGSSTPFGEGKAWLSYDTTGPGDSATNPAPLVAADHYHTFEKIQDDGGNVYDYNNLGPGTGYGNITVDDVNSPDFGLLFIAKNKNNIPSFTGGWPNVTYQLNEMELSVYYTDPQGKQRVQIVDDKLGNLIDKGLDTDNMVPSDNLLAYWGFNDKFKYQSQLYKREYGKVYNIIPDGNLNYKNLTFLPGIKTTGTVETSGIKAVLDGTGFMWMDEAQQYNFDFKADFAISFWVEAPTTQTNTDETTNFIFSKQGDVKSTLVNKITKNYEGYEDEGIVVEKTVYEPYENVKYPFAIKIHNQTSGNNGKLEVSKCDIQNTPTIISSTALNDGQQHHIVFQKKGNNLELWVDGVLDGTTPDTTQQSKLNTHNDAILTIGSKGHDRGHFTGNLDEIRIYDRGLTQTEVTSLSDNDYVTGTAYNTAIVGNVFYPQGTMVISDPRPKYKKILLGTDFDYTSSVRDNFKLEYRSTLTMTEQEVVCRVAPGEFNFTSNPTIREYTDMESPDIKGFATSSDWHPYVTTIGLYDEYGRMLAVGKTAQAIPIYDNVETTFIVRYDE
jgi:hypothetical protein